jgi:XrtN system VIT domain protein
METLAEPVAPLKFARIETQSEKPDRTTQLGYLLLAVSVMLYCLEEYLDVDRGNENFMIFFAHYFISIGFVITLLINKSYGVVRSWRRNHIHKTIILLNLFLVSAYALNRELPVFEDSVSWLCVFILITSSTMLSYQYFDRLPKAVNSIQLLFLGSALVLYVYMSIYVANFYLLGAVGVILFGIGAHILVPVLLLVAAIRLIIISDKKRQHLTLAWIASGAIITIGLAITFIAVWNSRVKAIDRLANQSVLHSDTDLPVWVKVAQSVKRDWITERILKSNLVYTSSNNFQWEFFPNRNWDEKRKHDPLVFLATLNKVSSLSEEDRKSILKTLTDSRHRAQERLWSGDNLTTSNIVTDVEIYPELRLAYSEQYLNIRNNARENRRWWGNSEEAIYTFQLPEGSVVTSLSLWVNGKEQKAILTSKQKANEAYTTIVGREMRDPSVVHWQEGNTISVRVFPCTPEEERKFKIGVTSPLPVVGDQIIYRSVTFRGPDANTATQTSRVRFIGNPQNVELPDAFEKNIKGEYFSEANYDPESTIKMLASPLKSNQFSFDGFTYSLSDSHPSLSKVEFNDIYLDLNNSWTSDEIHKLESLLKDHHVQVFTEDAFVQLSPENWKEVTNTLTQRNFSLFPFHHIQNIETALVITKGRDLSPYLRDFKDSPFTDGVSKFFKTGKKVNVFNLEGGTSAYIKSLRELRAFNFAEGNPDEALTLLKNQQFPFAAESEECVVFHDSKMILQKKVKNGETLKDTAPDHLARLFAYNNIMRQVGVNFFKDDFISEALVDEAATAYVVTPVSSLIVLETKEDYERFGIKDKDNSLHNASKNSSGAVPEPHEWALIIVFLLFIVFQVFRNPKLKFLKVKR